MATPKRQFSNVSYSKWTDPALSTMKMAPVRHVAGEQDPFVINFAAPGASEEQSSTYKRNIVTLPESTEAKVEGDKKGLSEESDGSEPTEKKKKKKKKVKTKNKDRKKQVTEEESSAQDNVTNDSPPVDAEGKSAGPEEDSKIAEAEAVGGNVDLPPAETQEGELSAPEGNPAAESQATEPVVEETPEIDQPDTKDATEAEVVSVAGAGSIMKPQKDVSSPVEQLGEPVVSTDAVTEAGPGAETVPGALIATDPPSEDTKENGSGTSQAASEDNTDSPPRSPRKISFAPEVVDGKPHKSKRNVKGESGSKARKPKAKREARLEELKLSAKQRSESGPLLTGNEEAAVAVETSKEEPVPGNTELPAAAIGLNDNNEMPLMKDVAAEEGKDGKMAESAGAESSANESDGKLGDLNLAGNLEEVNEQPTVEEDETGSLSPKESISEEDGHATAADSGSERSTTAELTDSNDISADTETPPASVGDSIEAIELDEMALGEAQVTVAGDVEGAQSGEETSISQGETSPPIENEASSVETDSPIIDESEDAATGTEVGTENHLEELEIKETSKVDESSVGKTTPKTEIADEDQTPTVQSDSTPTEESLSTATEPLPGDPVEPESSDTFPESTLVETTELENPAGEILPSPTLSKRAARTSKELHSADHWTRPALRVSKTRGGSNRPESPPRSPKKHSSGHRGFVRPHHISFDEPDGDMLAWARQVRQEATNAANEEERKARRESKRTARVKVELKKAEEAEERKVAQSERRIERRKELDRLIERSKIGGSKERDVDTRRTPLGDAKVEMGQIIHRRHKGRHEVDESSKLTSSKDTRKKQQTENTESSHRHHHHRHHKRGLSEPTPDGTAEGNSSPESRMQSKDISPKRDNEQHTSRSTRRRRSDADESRTKRRNSGLEAPVKSLLAFFRGKGG